jgi:hypothetical protein
MPGVWSVLIGCLYETQSSSSQQYTTEVASLSPPEELLYNLALHALHTLLNMVQPPLTLDVTGQIRVCDALFLNDAPLYKLGFGGMYLAKRLYVKEDVVDIPTSMIMELAGDYLNQVWCLFSGLCHVISHCTTTPRAVLLVALDVLKEAMDQVGGVVAIDAKEEIPSMTSIMKQMPQSIVTKLVDCLWIPRLGPDALDYVDPIKNVVSRVSTLKLRMGYEATVDTELRDRALDILVPWLALEEVTLSAKLGFCETNHNNSINNNNNNNNNKIRTRLYDAVVPWPCLVTAVGRNEAPSLAFQLLKYMSASPKNQAGLAYIQDRVLEMVSRNARVTQLAFLLYKPNVVVTKRQIQSQQEVVNANEEKYDSDESNY